MNIEDFKAVNRALKRKVRKARKDNNGSMTESTDFMENISKAFDELLFEHTHIELPHLVNAERSET
jgi:hypothetical protein